MNVVASVEARMTSSRLPGKMAMPLGTGTVLGVLLDRLKQVPEIDEIVVATTANQSDDVLAKIAAEHSVKTFRGSEDDVLGRVNGALSYCKADICVEITGDCPLTDPKMVSAMIAEFLRTRGTNHYIANTTGPEFGAPPGFDVQVFEVSALQRISELYQDAESREHVSLPFYRDGPNSIWAPRFVTLFPADVCKEVWLSLDYQEDYVLIREVHEELVMDDTYYTAADAIEACLARPKMARECIKLREM